MHAGWRNSGDEVRKGAIGSLKIKITLPNDLIDQIDAMLRDGESRTSKIRELIQGALTESCHEADDNTQNDKGFLSRIQRNQVESMNAISRLTERLDEIARRSSAIANSLHAMNSKRTTKHAGKSNDDVTLSLGYFCVGVLVCWGFVFYR